MLASTLSKEVANRALARIGDMERHLDTMASKVEKQLAVESTKLPLAEQITCLQSRILVAQEMLEKTQAKDRSCAETCAVEMEKLRQQVRDLNQQAEAEYRRRDQAQAGIDSFDADKAAARVRYDEDTIVMNRHLSRADQEVEDAHQKIEDTWLAIEEASLEKKRLEHLLEEAHRRRLLSERARTDVSKDYGVVHDNFKAGVTDLRHEVNEAMDRLAQAREELPKLKQMAADYDEEYSLARERVAGATPAMRWMRRRCPVLLSSLTAADERPLEAVKDNPPTFGTLDPSSHPPHAHAFRSFTDVLRELAPNIDMLLVAIQPYVLAKGQQLDGDTEPSLAALNSWVNSRDDEAAERRRLRQGIKEAHAERALYKGICRDCDEVVEFSELKIQAYREDPAPASMHSSQRSAGGDGDAPVEALLSHPDVQSAMSRHSSSSSGALKSNGAHISPFVKTHMCDTGLTAAERKLLLRTLDNIIPLNSAAVAMTKQVNNLSIESRDLKRNISVTRNEGNYLRGELQRLRDAIASGRSIV
ncbi:hypothetical protein DIPPA_10438 [Diplonema papillatum]|nr:hypothetical protein DIPPA_10438 [Diplonema papillatum]